ncbi:MAG: 50S ribosomal protein L9 [Candidatus Kapabacteria bacterium]|nr:50S ribosomal protein L9 [Candidatus Kapabacteria bacterium]
MKVILRQDVENLGTIGELVNVKDGYARNYLIPRELAYFATDSAIKRLESERKHYEKRQQQVREQAELTAAKLAELQISIPMQTGEEGKLFGSVTPQMIAQELTVRGFDIDRRTIIIDEPIKSLGVFDVKVKLHHDVMGNLKVWVISQE